MTNQTTNTAAKKSGSSFLLTLAVISIACIIFANFLPGKNLKGAWEYDSYGYTFTIAFTDDSHGYLDTTDEIINFTYTKDNGYVTLKTEDTLQRYGDVVTYKYKISGKKLTMTDAENPRDVMTLTKRAW